MLLKISDMFYSMSKNINNPVKESRHTFSFNSHELCIFLNWYKHKEYKALPYKCLYYMLHYLTLFIYERYGYFICKEEYEYTGGYFIKYPKYEYSKRHYLFFITGSAIWYSRDFEEVKDEIRLIEQNIGKDSLAFIELMKNYICHNEHNILGSDINHFLRMMKEYKGTDKFKITPDDIRYLYFMENKDVVGRII